MLHVTNGDSAAALLQQFLDEAVLPWRDVLHDGPVGAPPTRAKHLARRFGVDEATTQREMEARDEKLREAAHVTVWFEHDLYDQLQLLQVLSLREDVSAVVHGEHLGEMAVEELAALRPVTVSAAESEAARAAWGAFTGPDPRAWARVEGDVAALLIDAPSEWLGGTRTADWRWDPAAAEAVPA